MNLLADEGVDGQIVAALRQAGHEVWYVAEMEPGISDAAVLDLAVTEGRLLLTADKDFGELVFRQHLLMSGIVLIRLAGVSPVHKAEIVTAVINGHAAELRGAFTVISPRQVRIRRAGR